MMPRDAFALRADVLMLRRLGQRSACFRQEREASGYSGAEAQGQIITRSLALTPAAVATIVAAEQIFPMVGVLAGDDLAYSNRASATQSGAGLIQGRISSAGNVALSWVNPTAGGVTPTAETYRIGLYRR